MASARRIAAVRTGFIETDKDGKRIATGKDGCEGFLMWLCLNEPRDRGTTGQNDVRCKRDQLRRVSAIAAIAAAGAASRND